MSTPHLSVDILTVGESMGLVVMEDIGPLATADRARVRFGGAESNVAIAATRLGASVAWVSRLGNDGLGDKIERTLRGEAVDVRVRRDTHRPTGLMIKERRTSTSTRVHYYRSSSAATALEPDDIPDEWVQNARLVHVTGITSALSPSARMTVRSVLQRARDAGVTVSLDLNYRSALWSTAEAAAEYIEVLPFVDLLFGGLDELRLVDASIDTAAAAEPLLRRFSLNQVIVKEGAHGATAVSERGLTSHPAYTVQVNDTVGAGDAFVAGYLTAWLQDHNIDRCLDRATRAGALACTVPGDWEGAPLLSELALLDSAEPVER